MRLEVVSVQAWPSVSVILVFQSFLNLLNIVVVVFRSLGPGELQLSQLYPSATILVPGGYLDDLCSCRTMHELPLY